MVKLFFDFGEYIVLLCCIILYNYNWILFLVDLKKDCIDSALVHEIGHSVDTLYNGNTLHKLSDTTEFKSLYEEEKDGFYPVTSSEEVRNYLRSTRLEYFAESFLMYIQYPDYLQDMCPKTYEYMENLVENI